MLTGSNHGCQLLKQLGSEAKQTKTIVENSTQLAGEAGDKELSAL